VNRKDETIAIRFTRKAQELNEQIAIAYEQWLEASELTHEELLEYCNVKGFHIVDDEVGYSLAYYEKGIEKYIGVGFYKEQKNVCTWLFGFICALLERERNYETHEFSRAYIEWGKKHER
jgi:hypothetical protein